MEQIMQYDAEFLTLDGITEDGLLFCVEDAERAAEVFIREGVDGIFVPHCNFGSEESTARLCSLVKKPVLLWGPKDYINEEDGYRYRDSQCGLFATSKVLYQKRQAGSGKRRSHGRIGDYTPDRRRRYKNCRRDQGSSEICSYEGRNYIQRYYNESLPGRNGQDFGTGSRGDSGVETGGRFLISGNGRGYLPGKCGRRRHFGRSY